MKNLMYSVGAVVAVCCRSLLMSTVFNVVGVFGICYLYIDLNNQ